MSLDTQTVKSRTAAPDDEDKLAVDVKQLLSDLEGLGNSFPEVRTFDQAVQSQAKASQQFSVMQKARDLWDKMCGTVQQYNGQLAELEKDINQKQEALKEDFGEDRIAALSNNTQKDVPDGLLQDSIMVVLRATGNVNKLRSWNALPESFRKQLFSEEVRSYREQCRKLKRENHELRSELRGSIIEDGEETGDDDDNDATTDGSDAAEFNLLMEMERLERDVARSEEETLAATEDCKVATQQLREKNVSISQLKAEVGARDICIEGLNDEIAKFQLGDGAARCREVDALKARNREYLFRLASNPFDSENANLLINLQGANSTIQNLKGDIENLHGEIAVQHQSAVEMFDEIRLQEASLADLSARNKNLRASLAAQNWSLRCAASDKIRLGTQLSLARLGAENLQGELVDMKEQASDLMSSQDAAHDLSLLQLRTLTTQHGDLTTEHRRVRAQYANLTTQHRDLDQRCQQLVISERNVTAENDRLQREKSAMEQDKVDKEKLEADKRQLDQVKNQLEAKQSQLEADNEHLNNDRQQLEAEKSQLNIGRDRLEQDERQLALDKGTFEDVKRKLQDASQKLTATVSRLEFENGQLVASNEQLDRDKKQLDADKQSRGSTITDLQRDSEELKKAKQSLEDDKLGLRSKIDGLDKTVSGLQQRNSELETDVANGKSTLKTAHDALATTGKEVQDERSAKEVFKAQLAEAEDNHRKSMEELTRNKDILSRERQEFKDELARQDPSYASLSQAYKAKESELAKVTLELYRQDPSYASLSQAYKAKESELAEVTQELDKTKDPKSRDDLAGGMFTGRAWRVIGELLAETSHFPAENEDTWSRMARILLDSPLPARAALAIKDDNFLSITIRPPGYSLDADSVRRLESTSLRILAIEVFVYIQDKKVATPECLEVLAAITDRSPSCDDNVVAYLIRECSTRFYQTTGSTLSTAVGIFTFSLRQLMDAMEARFPGSQDAVIMDKIDRMLSSKTASNSLLRALTLIWRSDDPLEDIKASLSEDFALFGDTALITIPSSKWIICIRLPHEVTAIAKSLFEEVDSFDLDHIEYEVLPSGVLPSILFMADTESALEWMRRTLTYTQDPGEGAKDILARVEAGEDIFG